jgi:hypothetical protein
LVRRATPFDLLRLTDDLNEKSAHSGADPSSRLVLHPGGERRERPASGAKLLPEGRSDSLQLRVIVEHRRRDTVGGDLEAAPEVLDVPAFVADRPCQGLEGERGNCIGQDDRGVECAPSVRRSSASIVTPGRFSASASPGTSVVTTSPTVTVSRALVR